MNYKAMRAFSTYLADGLDEHAAKVVELTVYGLMDRWGNAARAMEHAAGEAKDLIAYANDRERWHWVSGQANRAADAAAAMRRAQDFEHFGGNVVVALMHGAKRWQGESAPGASAAARVIFEAIARDASPRFTDDDGGESPEDAIARADAAAAEAIERERQVEAEKQAELARQAEREAADKAYRSALATARAAQRKLDALAADDAARPELLARMNAAFDQAEAIDRERRAMAR